jgi:hypothetical protein
MRINLFVGDDPAASLWIKRQKANSDWSIGVEERCNLWVLALLIASDIYGSSLIEVEFKTSNLCKFMHRLPSGRALHSQRSSWTRYSNIPDCLLTGRSMINNRSSPNQLLGRMSHWNTPLSNAWLAVGRPVTGGRRYIQRSLQELLEDINNLVTLCWTVRRSLLRCRRRAAQS